MPTIATISQNLEKGYIKMMRFDTDKILYVLGGIITGSQAIGGIDPSEIT